MKGADGAANPRRQAKQSTAVHGRPGRGQVAMQAAKIVVAELLVMVVMRHILRLAAPTLRLNEDRTDRQQSQ